MSQTIEINEYKSIIKPVIVFILIIIVLFWGLSATYKKYDIWAQEQEGRAELAKAEYNRQIAVVEANAKKESAKSLAEAEIERAKGVAQANKIIGESLKGNDAYLRYLWIQGLQENQNDVIYVPTEANLPILEATRTIKTKDGN